MIEEFKDYVRSKSEVIDAGLDPIITVCQVKKLLNVPYQIFQIKV